jgi:hypothetical protein
MRTSLLTPTLLALLLVAAGSAFGRAPDPNLFYEIRARHSDKCLEVYGGTGALGNGAPVVQWECVGAENQQWKFAPVANTGYYKISVRHSGKVLDVFGGIYSIGDQVDIQQRDFNGLDNQLWYLGDLGNGYYQIIAKHSEKGLDVRGASTDNRAQVQQYPFRWGLNQQWSLIPHRCP